MAKVSVIVCIYNVEPYIDKCIYSIINRKLDDIEIVLIDDGSTDGSSIICEKYAECDNRIHVIHKNNEGLSSARNDGIDISSAPYIMFVDGDDWVDYEFCNLTYEVANRNSSDLVLFNASGVLKTGKLIKKPVKIHEGVISEHDALYYNTCVSPAAWTGLYQRDLFTNVRFPSGMYYEDLGTTHNVMIVKGVKTP